jgi:hypothetical protein
MRLIHSPAAAIPSTTAHSLLPPLSDCTTTLFTAAALFAPPNESALSRPIQKFSAKGEQESVEDLKDDVETMFESQKLSKTKTLFDRQKLSKT